MVQDEDSSISRRLDVPSGPPKIVVIGLPVLGSVVALALVASVFWLWATARAFVVPQSAMAPAIFGGDEIHADATAFGFRLPLLGNVRDGTYPARGDVIVFDWPPDRSYVYVMRVIAVGGDEVLVHPDGSIDVRGKQLRRCAMGTWPKGRDPNRIADDRKAFVEWSDDHPYVILLDDQGTTGATCVEKACTVPANHLFVLGDNRNASEDSRHWGFVPSDHVIGRVKDARVPEDLPAYQKCVAERP